MGPKLGTGPGDVAKTKWAKVKTASAAGTDAWKGSAPPVLAQDDGQ